MGTPQREGAPGVTTTKDKPPVWNGRHGQGAMKSYREDKHEAAIWRSSRTPPERRSRKRNRRNESQEEGQ